MIKTITLLAQRPEIGDQQFELPQESSETSALTLSAMFGIKIKLRNRAFFLRLELG